MIECGKYVLPSGIAYEVLTMAMNSETKETYVVYREVYNNRMLYTCSEEWWNSQHFISLENYTRRGITMYSSTSDKIKLYMSLFIGRDDVYAKRWESRKGKCGYSPVCMNEWNPFLCGKPNIKCSDCKNKNYSKLDYSVINNHLLGNIVVGIYPLLQDETCRFLAMDFDCNNWKEDISAVKAVCDRNSIPAYIERSRSGEGGHFWIFFSDNITAATARKLGSCVLTAAMNERHEIKFTSYDRLFPNQDTLPKGGFGNLIALPLQKKARENGNSIFVNEYFQAYADQWAFLSEVKTLSEIDVKEFIKKLGNDETGELYEDKTTKPWKKKKPVTLNRTDFPDSVNVILANMIYIDKRGISSKGLTQLKRLASFKNPDFYKSQAMRLSTYNKPRIISISEESEYYLGLPRGLFDDMVQIFVNNNIDIKITDETNIGHTIDVEFKGELRSEQLAAVDKMLQKDNGVLAASTAFGKTVVGISLIASRKVNTLILVHRTALLKQWIERLEEFLIINEEPPIEYTPKGRKRKKNVIGQLGGSKHNLSGIIDVAVMQSLISDNEVSDIVKNYGMVIIDECHHVSAFTFEQILKQTTAKYVYGLTATPVRQDGHQPIIYMQCGKIIFKADNKKQVKEQPFQHYMLPRFTPYRTISDKIAEIYSDITEDEFRNNLIIDDCKKLVEEGRTPIILTERTRHVEILAEKLQEYNIVKLIGGMGNKKNTEIMNKLYSIPSEENLIIIATGKYVGEGFDFPRLDTLLLAMPISWKGTLQQYAGRLHRNYDNKEEVRIYDYIDINVPMLEKMYQKRLNGYSSMGYQTKCVNNIEKSINSIYDNKNFFEIFITDINAAEKEILIVSPFVSKRTIAKFSSAVAFSNKSITVITRPIEDYKSDIHKKRVQECINLLEQWECKIMFRTMIHQKFSIIDKKLIWYGSINFLSFGNSEESIMRLESADIAGELMDSVMDTI